MSVRTGVIGVGYLGQHHARIYSQLEDTELAGVADIDYARAQEIAQKYGCRAFSDYREIINLCDALSIAAPTPTHYSIAMDCIRAGRDVLIEKPVTERVDEADEIVREAESRGCIVQVGHLERYNQAVVAAAVMIKEPKFIESERLSPFLERAADVDVTLDLMIHDIDLIMSIIDSPLIDLRAVGASVLTDKIDAAKAWLEFENGCAALITAGRLSPEKVRTLKIHQKDSYILIDFQGQKIRRYARTGSGLSSDVIRPENKEPLKEEIADFIRCVKSRQKPPVSGREAMGALEVALRITEKLKNTQGPDK